MLNFYNYNLSRSPNFGAKNTYIDRDHLTHQMKNLGVAQAKIAKARLSDNPVEQAGHFLQAATSLLKVKDDPGTSIHPMLDEIGYFYFQNKKALQENIQTQFEYLLRQFKK